MLFGSNPRQAVSRGWLGRCLADERGKTGKTLISGKYTPRKVFFGLVKLHEAETCNKKFKRTN